MFFVVRSDHTFALLMIIIGCPDKLG